MSKPRKRWGELILEVYDCAQMIVAALLFLVLLLDGFNLVDVSWFAEERILLSLIFGAVCLLIVASFFERRIKLDNILSQQQELSTQMREFAPPCIRFTNRSKFEESFEGFLEDAKRVDIFGMSLMPVITTYWGCLSEKVKARCEFRFLLVDPNCPAVNTAMASVEDTLYLRPPNVREDIQNSVRRLEPLLKMGNAKLRFTSFAPSFGLLITDPGKPNGKTQVELYAYGISPGDRPHFAITQAYEPWYDFFTQQFERLWESAREHRVSQTDDV